jgi:hypothetical protein
VLSQGQSQDAVTAGQLALQSARRFAAVGEDDGFAAAAAGWRPPAAAVGGEEAIRARRGRTRVTTSSVSSPSAGCPSIPE